ncbi:CocE/NonD family hydrolase [Kitasatospora cineracea]|uniref:Xaa-Pro dipeptidyl-peptidase C-terminal domain-containing protein n=1 Tax=Kitasatospora cineracea TaxID=88074 RepID=A0A8G1ULY6_9ACTN|nr:CocE/NonD family hydrolase [Kitasatospora cineracea]ROR46510.1 hypothetical protein EDD39_4785 [Kitasatospora cineracea]
MSFRIVESASGEKVPASVCESVVAMRDGNDLATSVYLPEGDGVHSTILVRTPYARLGRHAVLEREAEYFRGRGFAFVTQGLRDKRLSQDGVASYSQEVADGYDTVEWITRQPWSNGSVGVTGSSCSGFTAWAAVASGHPAIKAAVPKSTSIDLGAGYAPKNRRQGVPVLAALKDLLQFWSDPDGCVADAEQGAVSAADASSETCEQIVESRSAKTRGRHSPYGYHHPLHATAIPVLHWQYWYDRGFAPSGLRDWRHFRSLTSTRHLHYLRAGSADHAGFRLEDVDAEDEYASHLNGRTLAEKIVMECEEVADFFDEHLNGIAPRRPRPQARWHVGHVGWQSSHEYPPPSTPLTFHLEALLGERVHRLSRIPAADPVALSWIHDPGDPVPSSVGIESIWYLLADYPDERALQDRTDVLTFRTGPLSESVDFAGQPLFHGRVDLPSGSAHLHLKLQDVHPDGTTRPISWGHTAITRAAGRSVTLPLTDNAYRLQPGHRLQLQIQSSDFPHFGVYPGARANPRTAAKRKAIRQVLTVGGIHGASLTLPAVRLVQDSLPARVLTDTVRAPHLTTAPAGSWPPCPPAGNLPARHRKTTADDFQDH